MPNWKNVIFPPDRSQSIHDYQKHDHTIDNRLFGSETFQLYFPIKTTDESLLTASTLPS